jgi:restriction system protein
MSPKVSGALIAFWKAFADRGARVPSEATPERLAALTHEELTRWCASRLRAADYSVRPAERRGDDLVDLVAKRDGLLTIVRCGGTSALEPQGDQQLDELIGAMPAFNASRAMVISATGFTPQAREWARTRPVDLVDAGRLADIDQVDVMTLPFASPGCERCNAPLQLKRARATGELFYGCSRFPRCRYRRTL